MNRRSSFDLITVDVTNPRATASSWCAEHGLVVVEDEDDGRWVVLARPGSRRVFGLQRSDAREINARTPSRGTVEGTAAIFAAVDPARSAAFWGDVAGLATIETGPDRCTLGLASGEPVLAFVRAEHVAIPEAARSIVHLDLACDPEVFDAEVARLLDLGAVRVGPLRAEQWGRNQILSDPDGSLFCLNAYPH